MNVRRSIATLAALGALVACQGGADIGSDDFAMWSNGPVEGTFLERFQDLHADGNGPEIPPAGEPQAEAAPGDDRDGDGIEDFHDNCPDLADSSNFDADGDGYGNACDADYDGDGYIAGTDFSVFFAAFGSARGDENYDSRADHNLDGFVSLIDYATFLQQFGSALPASEGVVPFDSVQAGDTISYVIRYTDVDNEVGVVTVTSVERNSDGSVRQLTLSSGRLIAFAEDVWVLDRLLFLLIDPGPPTIATNCDRAVIFPRRAVNNFSHLCGSIPTDGLSINVSR